MLRQLIRHLIKESTSLNATALYTMTDKNGDTAVTLFLLDDSLIHKILHVHSLQNNKIVKVLGSGAFGIAYLLDNDHVFKLFISQDIGGTLKKYKEMQDRQFAGSARKNEPAIYDVGNIAGDLDYVEMGRVITVEEWLDNMGVKNKQAFNAVMNVLDILYSEDRLPQNPRAAMGEVWKELSSRVDDLIVASLPKSVIAPLVRATTDYIYRVHPGGLFDISIDNVGIIPTSDYSNPSFVLFDV